jgi:SpoVK/Ycf46/Vps4 family AAA+-type ATPase
MDGIDELAGVVVLAATNRADMLDPALCARDDSIRSLKSPPHAAARLAILRVHSRGRPMVEDIDLIDVARLQRRRLEKLIRDAAMDAVREQITENVPVERTTPLAIRAAHFTRAFVSSRGSEIAGLAPVTNAELKNKRASS